MDKRAKEINAFYGVKAKNEAKAAAERSARASHAANARWDGRGESTVIRISREVAARLNEEVAQPERRPFVDNAVTEALDRKGHV